jgi:hypothetical protein
MFNLFKNSWHTWHLKRLKRKRDSLKKEYTLNVAQLAEQMQRLAPKSRAVSYRRIWLKEVERRILLMDDKIAALDPSEAVYQDLKGRKVFNEAESRFGETSLHRQPLKGRKVTKCLFTTYTRCSKPADETGYCEEHRDLKCHCGRPATWTCGAEHMGLVCGISLCDECQCPHHSYRR